MDEKVLSALVAGLVALFVSVISFASMKRQLQAKREELERGIEARHTEKLYDLRVKNYPKAFTILGKISIPKSTEWKIRREIYSSVYRELKEWRSGEPMMVLSKNALNQLWDLEKALKRNPDNNETFEYSPEHVSKIFHLNLRVRGALRQDIGLLFVETETDDHPE